MVGLEPWRLAGATGPRVATGSPGSVATLKDAGLGVEVAYVSERYAGAQPAASSAAENAKIVPPMRLVMQPSIISGHCRGSCGSEFLKPRGRVI